MFDLMHNLVDTPLKGCGDMFVHEQSFSLCCNNVLPSSFDDSHVSLICS